MSKWLISSTKIYLNIPFTPAYFLLSVYLRVGGRIDKICHFRPLVSNESCPFFRLGVFPLSKSCWETYYYSIPFFTCILHSGYSEVARLYGYLTKIKIFHYGAPVIVFMLFPWQDYYQFLLLCYPKGCGEVPAVLQVSFLKMCLRVGYVLPAHAAWMQFPCEFWQICFSEFVAQFRFFWNMWFDYCPFLPDWTMLGVRDWLSYVFCT